jgi:WD40 repeat protein
MPRVKSAGHKSRSTGLTVKPAWRQTLDDHVIDVAWSDDGALLAAATVSGAVGAWRAPGDRCFLAPAGHRLGAMAVAWQPGASVLASSGQDGMIRLWDGQDGTPFRELEGGAAWVSHVCWCPAAGGRLRLASAAGRSVRFWNAAGDLQQEYSDFPSTVSDIRWHSGRGELAIAAYGGITLCRPDDAADPRRLPWLGSALVLAWSPDGRCIASGDQDATVHFWLSDSDKNLQMWGYPRKVRELAWDATGRYLATGGGHSVTVWDCGGQGPEGTKPIQLRGTDAALTVLTYQWRSDLLAAAAEDGRVTIWAPARVRRQMAALEIDAPVTRLAWSPDDRLLAVAGADGTVGVYSVNV